MTNLLYEFALGSFFKLGKRQPLIKTNGILFLKTREKEELRQRGKPYQDVKDCAMTRSNVVADWTLDLKDHQVKSKLAS